MPEIMTVDPDSLFDDAPVASIQIVLRRSGVMAISGSINDEAYALKLLDTARDSVRNHHHQVRIGRRGGLLIPAHDTAITGTEQERQLLKAKEELISAHDLVSANAR